MARLAPSRIHSSHVLDWCPQLRRSAQLTLSTRQQQNKPFELPFKISIYPIVPLTTAKTSHLNHHRRPPQYHQLTGLIIEPLFLAQSAPTNVWMQKEFFSLRAASVFNTLILRLHRVMELHWPHNIMKEQVVFSLYWPAEVRSGKPPPHQVLLYKNQNRTCLLC